MHATQQKNTNGGIRSVFGLSVENGKSNVLTAARMELRKGEGLKEALSGVGNLGE